MKIFSKITSNGYNEELEKILETKAFPENSKNLLLSMLYKIENGYKDYAKVKPNAITKEEFIEKILQIIDKQCFELDIVTPKTEMSKPLEALGKICKIDVDKGSILVYANEEDLLYSIIQMDLLQNENHISDFYEQAKEQFKIQSKCINESEIIRDFDGWSWNNNLKSKASMYNNLIYQNISMLKQNINFEITTQNEFEKNAYIIILMLASQKDGNVKAKVVERYNELVNTLELMNDKIKFLNKLTEEKRRIADEIKKIDETINDKTKLKVEYNNRNSKLPNREKIFSVSVLADILEKERKGKLNELKELNKFLDPKEYVVKKDKLIAEKNILERTLQNLTDEKALKQTITEMQIGFLKDYGTKIEERIDDKEELEKLIYEFRYYCLIPVEKNKCIKDIHELQMPIEKVMNRIIDNSIYKGLITNFSNSESLCYTILKYVFSTKIIDLREIQIKIQKISEEKYVNETQSKISISICDTKTTEREYTQTVNNLKQLNVRTNKMIPLFLK